MLLRRHRHGDGAAQCSKYYIFIKDALRSPVKSFALMSVIAFMAALVRTDVETNTRKRTRKCSERVYIILCTLPSGRRRLTTMSVGCDTPANRFEFFMFFFFFAVFHSKHSYKQRRVWFGGFKPLLLPKIYTFH